MKYQYEREAGFWIRLGAYFLDGLFLTIGMILMLVFLAVVMLFAAAILHLIPKSIQPIIAIIVNILLFTAGFAYQACFVGGPWQATPGKRAVGLYVVREDGLPVSGLLAIGRYLSYFLSSVPFCIGFMMIGWTEHKQGIHDKVCGTRVLRGKL